MSEPHIEATYKFHLCLRGIIRDIALGVKIQICTAAQSIQTFSFDFTHSRSWCQIKYRLFDHCSRPVGSFE